MRNAFKISVGKSHGKRQLGLPTCKGKNNIKMDPGGTRSEGVVAWIQLAPHRVSLLAFVKTAMNIQVL
jgi:hypothetical protein